MSSRSPRTQRRPGVRVVLGPRDEALLRGLARFRVATTSQLVSLFFRGVRRDTAAVRLRRLYDAGVLDVAHSGLNAENIYAIGPAGRRWLAARGLSAGAPPRGQLDHHLGLVGLWTGLAAALHGSSALHLVRFTPDWEGRQQKAGTGALVIPDAEVLLTLRPEAGGPNRVRLFVELDLGTERHGALARKLVAYAAESPGEATGLVVILEGAGDARLAAVRRLVAEHWPSWSLVCRRLDWPGPLLATLGHESRLPHPDSPCGEGSPAGATLCGSTATRNHGEGHSR